MEQKEKALRVVPLLHPCGGSIALLLAGWMEVMLPREWMSAKG